MSTIPFTKMHGCGNDYVVVDAYSGVMAERFAGKSVESAGPLARATNDRRFGVGADGFVLILPETRGDSPADYEMRMYNPDGSYSAMCGNALRCVAKRLIDSGGHARESMLVRTNDTLVPMRVTSRDSAGRVDHVEADLGAPTLEAASVPCRIPPNNSGAVVDADFAVAGATTPVTVVSMGNPHCVVFTDEATDDLVLGIGPQIETHEAFPDRTNVEFVVVESPTRLRQRTWERGAGETLACGSGACAVAVAAALTERAERRVTIELLGGELDLEWRESDNHVVMTGPAVDVFRGEWADRAS